MSSIYTHHLIVPASVIDDNGHVNNVAYVQWMQDAAVAHSEAVGGIRATMAIGATWVVRRHSIEYRRPAFAGDAIEIKTWVHDYRRVASLRKYEFVRTKDKTLLAIGETDWVFLDTTTLRPKAIPAEIQQLYQ